MDGRRSGINQRSRLPISRRFALRGFGAAGVGAALGMAARPVVATAAAAQDGTPTAGACPGDPSVGDAVSVVGPDGAELIRITASEVIDPFEDYDPSGSPPRGQRFVIVRIDAEAVSPRPFDLIPNTFSLQDADGFLAQQVNIRLAADVTIAPLERVALEAGAVARGFLGFSVLGGVDLHRLFFAPASDRLVLVADLRG